MLPLLLVLVAGVHSQGLIRSKAHVNGKMYCMRTPSNNKGAAIQLVPCSASDPQQRWKRVKGKYWRITAQSNGMQMTMRNYVEHINNVVVQSKTQPELNQWDWDHNGPMKWVRGIYGPSSYHSLHADTAKNQVILRRHHHGKHQFWEYISPSQLSAGPQDTPKKQAARRAEQQILARTNKWMRRWNRGRRLLAEAPAAGLAEANLVEAPAAGLSGRLLDAIEE